MQDLITLNEHDVPIFKRTPSKFVFVLSLERFFGRFGVDEADGSLTSFFPLEVFCIFTFSIVDCKKQIYSSEYVQFVK